MIGMIKPIEKLGLLLRMIKFEHTVFALPFAFFGAFLAARGLPDIRTSIWIVVAMAGARTAAMGFNRIIDLPFDSKNPRTSNRALPKGKVSNRETWIMVIVSAGVYFLATSELNHLAFSLSPLGLAIILFYSYTKRFTFLCHVFLGLAIGLAPIAGWIAVKGNIELLPIVLSTAVLFWVGGFDVLYACLDINFDRKMGIHSIPAAFGTKKAFSISGMFHLISFTMFTFAGIMAHLNWIYFCGLAIVLILSIIQHFIISPNDLSRMDMAFFTCNGAISLILFAATVLSLVFKT